VQRVADQVRVNVQLLNAQTESQLWAETYDRKVTDIFGVESEIAKAIARSLQATLTGHEEQVLAIKPTNNPEAYDAYLRGLAYTLKAADTPAIALGAQKHLKEAVKLDPNFALAWARLSYTDSVGFRTTNLQPTIALREEAQQAAETALALQPTLGEALHAMGYYYYSCLRDYDTAVRYFDRAHQFLPNSSQIPESLAYVARRRGELDRSETYFEEAQRLDPRNVNILTQHALLYIDQRRFTEAQRKLDEVLNITPDDIDTLATKAAIAQAEGDLARAAMILAPLRPSADLNQALETQIYQAILERRPSQIVVRLKELLANPDPALAPINGKLRFWLGWAQHLAGEHAEALATWSKARSELESLLHQQPEDYFSIGTAALTAAYMGDKPRAIALAEQLTAKVSTDKDAVLAAVPIEFFARVAAQTGERDEALNALQKLLSMPGEGALAENVPLTPALLRLDPMFDSLRNDRQFQKLCEKKQP
jgi:tetratricopeptide (TPR) repeat protein